MNTSKSLFSLVNHNKGLFKSEKQADFLKAQATNGVIYSSQSFVFGEFNGCKRTIVWEFLLDDQGIKAVYKVNSKGERSTHWKRENSYIEAFEAAQKAKKEKQAKADKVNLVSKSLDRAEAFNKTLSDRLYKLCLVIDVKDFKTNKDVINLKNKILHFESYRAIKQAKYGELLNEL